PAKRPAACRALFASLSEYLDDRVEPGACLQMTRHIEGCPSCVAFLNDLRAAIDRCRSLEVPCDPRIAARLRSTLNQEIQRMTSTHSSQEISAHM
ncbi:MAG TPA: zf-HC2 domain-containing protein, partial [Terracidiphilus sp.]|nr:zf-HC2 domain-containing protein [Terracidiphilus sp.]